MASQPSSVSIWIARGVVGAALVLTIWFAGPKAYAVVKHRLGVGAGGPLVDLGRVRVASLPPWMHGAILEQALADLEPALSGVIGLHDDAARAVVEARLAASPWVVSASLERRYPDGFTLLADLREPVLAVTVKRVVRALVASDGVVLPATARVPDLPVVELPAGVVERSLRPGEPCDEPRIVQSLDVAREWRDDVAPRVDGAPALLEIDARNLGGRYVADPRYSEIAIALASVDGGAAWMQYGRSAQRGGAVDPETKASILRAMLEEHPGLRGLSNGDLRLRNRWRDSLVTRAPLRTR